MERWPTEMAITNQIKAFKNISMKGVQLSPVSGS
jgi:hypothetical protein